MPHKTESGHSMYLKVSHTTFNGKIKMESATNFFRNRYSLTGLESTLNEEEKAFQDMMHRFAEEVVRPAGAALDKLTPEQVIAPNSVLWEVYARFAELGVMEILASDEVDPVTEARLMQIMLEELAWGDSGIAVSLGAGLSPLMHAKMFENQFVMEKLLANPGIGCWAISEPDHGSNQIMHGKGYATQKPNCIVKFDGDKLVINGQKAAWVSNGPVANFASLFTACDFGGEELGQCVVVVPMDAKGVSKGKPLDKIGQRALPQGEVYFDNVVIEKEWLLVAPENYGAAFESQLSLANAGMGLMFTGLARAAFEHALDYAHERKQGGFAIIEHQDVQRRLFDMFRKVEMCRALSHRVNEYIAAAPRPSLLAAAASKVSVTDLTFEVATSALQMFGGNGLTKEYPMEKLLRDARAAQIEDGCNHVLSIKGGSLLNKDNPLA